MDELENGLAYKVERSAISCNDVVTRRVRWIALPAALLLSACGPEMLKPAIPLDVSLTPTAIYLLPCAEDKKGFLGFLGAADRAPGEATCSLMWMALQRQVAGMKGRHVLLHVEKESDASNFEPDLAAEKDVGAAYRVILTPPKSYRTGQSDGGGGRMEWVQTSMQARFVSIADGKDLGKVWLNGRSSPIDMANDFSSRIVKGIEGPRCQPVNGYSIKATFKNAFSKGGCDSLTLRAANEDD
jgi:hypothetical protein